MSAHTNGDTFPHKTLSRIAEANTPPTYATLLTLQLQINANARAIHSSAGTGMHGHLVLTMKPVDYAVLTGNVAHPAPVYPGPSADIPAGSTGTQIARINNEHKADLHHFSTYHTTDSLLRAQLLAACPDMYTKVLRDIVQEYGNVTTLVLLTHLWTEYGTITEKQLQQNLERMKQPWHPTEPILNLFDQIDEAVAFAIAGESPIATRNILMTAYELIDATGVFTHACNTWLAMTAADPARKTMPEFQTHFKQAYQNLEATTKSAGYHAANAAIASNDKDLSKEIAQLRKEIAELKQQSHRTARTATPASVNNTPTGSTYCWTHGHSKNPHHTSITCMRKANGHQDAATSDNTMGGSTRVYTAADVIPRT